jgi:hypothetical protein
MLPLGNKKHQSQLESIYSGPVEAYPDKTGMQACVLNELGLFVLLVEYSE